MIARHEEVNALHQPGLVKPSTRDVQWINSTSSMDRRVSVNGLSSAIQWMEQCESMDGTSHVNGLTITLPSSAAKRTGVAYRGIGPSLRHIWIESRP